jgi:hypothetical protein
VIPWEEALIQPHYGLQLSNLFSELLPFGIIELGLRQLASQARQYHLLAIIVAGVLLHAPLYFMLSNIWQGAAPVILEA